jgi:hypothetical protein
MKKLIKYIFKKIENLFLWSSGADLDILSLVPMEKSKYFGIGGTIIFTALMASFAGGYAFFTAFKNPNLAVPFGLFWGTLIFNLDRYIVASFGVGDGKKTISRQEIIEAAPRLVMAIILGFVISTPLELKLFETEINAQIKQNINFSKQQIAEGFKNDPRLLQLQNQKKEFYNELDVAKKILDRQQTVLDSAISKKTKELYGKGISGSSGKGSAFIDLEQRAEKEKTEYNSQSLIYDKKNTEINKEIEDTDKLIYERKLEIKKILTELNSTEEKNNGLLSRLEALGDLTSKKPILSFSKWLITVLFIFIEIAPILFKMMTERGPYDDIVDRKKHEYKVRQLELQSNINQEINTAVRIHTDKYEQKLNAELQSNKEILEAIAKAQQEIAIVAIEKWKEEQKELMKQNGGTEIIKSSN